MAKIHVLDNQTIDKIAAGEVVERPSSVVKELVENAIDSGARAITVEIKDGGISFIRVTDNGCGIEKSQIQNAFLRHATSKISSAEDLSSLVSLGFRGEALASIAAVSMVELITKTEDELTGIRYRIEGGIEKEREEIGAPTGTTVLVKNLFFNTPPRKKFLKQPQTEGSYVADLMEHLAMSNPDISFKFVINGQNRFYTTGNDNLQEIIYRIYGKEMARELIPFAYQGDGIGIWGFLGKPVINRANRNYEIFFINGRYIKSTLIGKAVEEGFHEYLMQHKFPFCVLHFTIDTARIDVNVHPAKMEVRIADAPAFYEIVKNAVHDTLCKVEMIPEVKWSPDFEKKREKKTAAKETIPEPFESRRLSHEKHSFLDNPKSFSPPKPEETMPAAAESDGLLCDSAVFKETVSAALPLPRLQESPAAPAQTLGQTSAQTLEQTPKQRSLFDDKILSAEAKEQYEIVGQLFGTYWIVAYQDKMLLIDQHAAHEKVKYESMMRHFREHDIVSQALNPPLIVTLNGIEKECYLRNAGHFAVLGFEIEEFGGNDYAIRGLPMDLYGYEGGSFFYELLDELALDSTPGTPESIRMRIAAMACKAAVKGNTRLGRSEADALIGELLTLDNPYHCPHGRPTIISMSKQEIEKKFKRIV